MKSPAYLGLPDKFGAWRKGQLEALTSILYSKERFSLLCCPTGSGKSATYMSYAQVDDRRTAFVTASKVLQDQLQEFSKLGLKDMRGRNNYVCDIDDARTADTAVCTAGVFCQLSKGGCGYYDALATAANSRLVSTNYAFWLHDEAKNRLGDFQTVVLDEAHRAPDELSNFAAVELSGRQLMEFGITQPASKGWEQWALREMELLNVRKDGYAGHDRKRRASRIVGDLARLCRLSEHEWLFSQKRVRDQIYYRWDLVEPGAIANELLFRGAEKIILSSASIRRKTLRLLGVMKSKVTIVEQSSSFPIKRRPFYYWPVATLSRRAGDGDLPRWFESIDQIISKRLDRKGLIHPVSYVRAKQIVQNSKFRDSGYFLLHDRRQPLVEVLAEFDRSPAGTILVSPAIGEGLSFDYTRAEYQIIAKVPFPDMSSPLVQARTKKDRDYFPYVAAQAIMQQAGRINRAEDDQGETFCLDTAMGWLLAQYPDFFTHWFKQAIKTVRRSERPPDPPLPLTPF